jgi:hypothetical protein
MSAEGAKAINRWLSEAIPPVAEVAVLAPLRGATAHVQVSGGVAPLNRRLIAGHPCGVPGTLTDRFVTQFYGRVRTATHFRTAHSF